MSTAGLRDAVEALPDAPDPAWAPDEEAAALTTVGRLVEALSRGAVRAAEPVEGGWSVNAWVKRGILFGFRVGRIVDYSEGDTFRFFDKSTFPPRALTQADGVRMVPGGSVVRSGAYVAPGVVCMPPMYVNVGAYVGEGTLIDSHALVGSCAQVGRRVHVSAAAQIGGVLEPVGAQPVIVEDDVLLGGNTGVYEGTRVRRFAVIAAGTVLTRSTRIYDVVHGQVLAATADRPLEVPEGAVVVPGSRRVEGDFARQHGLGLYAPVIVKYRDAGTDARLALEDALR